MSLNVVKLARSVLQGIAEVPVLSYFHRLLSKTPAWIEPVLAAAGVFVGWVWRPGESEPAKQTNAVSLPIRERTPPESRPRAGANASNTVSIVVEQPTTGGGEGMGGTTNISVEVNVNVKKVGRKRPAKKSRVLAGKAGDMKQI